MCSVLAAEILRYSQIKVLYLTHYLVLQYLALIAINEFLIKSSNSLFELFLRCFSF